MLNKPDEWKKKNSRLVCKKITIQYKFLYEICIGNKMIFKRKKKNKKYFISMQYY